MTTVLVTGMSGLIGGAVRRRLEGRYALCALNRSRVEGLPCHQADIADLAAIRPAFAGVDMVVHLAAIASSQAPWDAVLRDNIIGTYNVFEAAREAGVRRVVFASSGATVSAYEREDPYAALVAGRHAGLESWPWLTHDTPVRPAGLYGASKVWGEALARHYADAHGLSAICVRLGAVNREDRPLAPRDFSVWLSQRDAAQIVDRALAAPDRLRFAIVFATSENRWGYRDLTHARDVLGFEPEDRAEDHRQGGGV
jgi:nucleoside-diphosphate-sugar epimerase